MEKQKEKVKGLLTAYAPFMLVLVIAVLYHLKIGAISGDDPFFAAATDDKTMWQFLSERYQTWTSRIVIDFLVVSLVDHLIVWKILDIIVFSSMPVLFAKILGDTKLVRWCSAAAILLYPFHDVGSAGWVTTTINYLWPIWGILLVGVLVKKVLCQEKILWYEIAAGVIGCILASSHEQAAVVLFIILLLAGIWLVRKHCLKVPVYYLMLLINMASLIFILTCPGNGNRNAVGTADMPEFANYTLFDKAYLGLLSIERVFIANVDIVFFMVVLLLAALVYIKTSDYKKTLISSLPVLILLGQSVIKTAYPELNGLFVVPEQVTVWSYGELSAWIPMVYLAVTVASILAALFWLLENMQEYISAVLLLGCGFAAGLVIGFTATIYVSGDRVYITLYFILLFICVYCIRKMEKELRDKLSGTAFKLLVTAVTLVCLVNVGYIWLSCS